MDSASNSSRDRSAADGHPTAPRPASARPKNRQRSRITNGTSFLPGCIDHRSAWVRRAKDIVAEYISDAGGEANTSTAERSIIRRIAVLTTELEALETRFAGGAATSETLDLYIRGSGTLRRLLEGFSERRARDVTNIIDGTVVEPWSPLRQSLREAAAREKQAEEMIDE
jgi:hypothetical protein